MKKRKHEHTNHERWLVSYADFITLLFAFFVVMYAISQADLEKFKKVSEGMRKAFGAAGQMDTGGSSGGNTVNPMEAPVAAGGQMLDLPAGSSGAAAAPESELSDMKDLLEETISMDTSVSDIADKAQLLYDSRGLVLRVAVKDFFPEGQSEVPAELRPLLERLGRVLNRSRRMIRIEGHADRGEEVVEGYPSDWELSAARAAWVGRYWISRLKMDPRRVAISGFGHHRPVTQSKQAWFRGGNRRIEIVVLNRGAEMLERGAGRPLEDGKP